MKFTGTAKEYLHLSIITNDTCHILKETIESGQTILWFKSDDNELVIDG